MKKETQEMRFTEFKEYKELLLKEHEEFGKFLEELESAYFTIGVYDEYIVETYSELANRCWLEKWEKEHDN